jgi:four helix bundle protein
MFLNLAHTKLDVFSAGKNLVLSCYKISKLLPPDKRFNMTQQLSRAAFSIQLNIANLRLSEEGFMKFREDLLWK